VIDSQGHDEAMAFVLDAMQRAQQQGLADERFVYGLTVTLGLLVRRMHETPGQRLKALNALWEVAHKASDHDPADWQAGKP
jgi:hypothetical protein